MEPTGRCWETAVLSLGIAGLAVSAGQATLLVGGLGLASLLVALQWRFARLANEVSGDVEIEATLAQQTVFTDEPLEVTIEARRPEPSSVDLAVDPPSASTAIVSDGTACRVSRGETSGSSRNRLAWPVAGEFDFDPPTVRIEGPFGLFTTEYDGEWENGTPSVTVRPPEPHNIHVGQQGKVSVPGADDYVEAGIGTSLAPTELREYQPGDSVRHIDWKATARLQYPHVREYESETDFATVLVLDHGTSMNEGPGGQTKLDYAREVALSFVTATRRQQESLGYYAAGDAGLTHEQAPRATIEAYRHVNQALLDVSATTEGERASADARGVSAEGDREFVGDDASDQYPNAPASRRPPADVVTISRELSGDPTAYGRTLGPLFDGSNPYDTPSDQPLFDAVRSFGGHRRERVRLVLLTDDVNRPGVRRAVREARRHASQVLVFLHPTVIFEPGGMADLDRAYDRYVDFERFRRELSAFDDVTAFEVGPGDRIDRILAAGNRDGIATGEVAK